MKISDLDQPRIGDIVEFETDPDTVVEGLIVGETADGYIYEFSDTGYTELHEACTYGKYYCSTDKKYKCRTGPKQERDVAEGTEHYDGIEISMEKEDDEIMVKAMMSGGRELGHVLFVIDGEYLAPQDLEVDERYQGQGIAATMYDYVKSKGFKIRRSGQQTDAGAGFWDKHKPGKNVWEQGVAEGSEHFNQCYVQACKIYDRAEDKKLNPVLLQVAGYKGDGSNADEKWLALPQRVWQHYVVVVNDTVYDPTAKQFGNDKPTKYSVEKLQQDWDQQYQIRPKQDVDEAHPNSKIYDKCWDGYKKVPGKKRGEKGSCVEESSGYIPRNSKEAQDPRWSSALTHDVTTHTMRDQIGKFFPTDAPNDGQEQIHEAEYHGREVPLGRPMRGDVKKFKVYVKDPATGNVKKVNFGDPNMRIKKSNPARRRSFRARHNCKSPGPRTKARYWSCRKW